MGYLDVEEEMIQWLQPTEDDKAVLMRHMSDIMPHPAEFGVNDWSGVREGQGGIVVNGEAELHGVCCDIGVCGRMHRP